MVSVVPQEHVLRGGGTHECAEDDGEGVDERGAGGEAPEEKGGERAAERAEEHHVRVRDAVGEVAEDNLADDARGVEERENDGGGERRGELLGEGRDVERDGEVGEALDEAGEGLVEGRINDESAETLLDGYSRS